MANWYNTYFKTEDREIADLIEEGQTINFYYDEESGDGYCSLRWGLNAIDMEAIELIAKDNHSTFLIRSSDVLTGTTHTWVYENGEEKVAKVTESEVVYKDVD